MLYNMFVLYGNFLDVNYGWFVHMYLYAPSYFLNFANVQCCHYIISEY